MDRSSNSSLGWSRRRSQTRTHRTPRAPPLNHEWVFGVAQRVVTGIALVLCDTIYFLAVEPDEVAKRLASQLARHPCVQAEAFVFDRADPAAMCQLWQRAVLFHLVSQRVRPALDVAALGRVGVRQHDNAVGLARASPRDLDRANVRRGQVGIDQPFHFVFCLFALHASLGGDNDEAIKVDAVGSGISEDFLGDGAALQPHTKSDNNPCRVKHEKLLA